MLSPDALLEPCAAIGDVVARMDAIAAELDPADGVARFNHLYRAVTVAVGEAVAAATFHDAAFLARLDVVFAGLYFRALAGWIREGRCARAWEPLFACRGSRRIAPLQFALAGMNAHINHDLALAVVATCAERDVEPVDRSGIHADYLAVNALLAGQQARAKEVLFDPALAHLDLALGALDDRVEHWSIVRARDTAWHNAKALWALRDLTSARDFFLDGIDRLTAVAGRGLLVPLRVV
jgi:hypothetical protein